MTQSQPALVLAFLVVERLVPAESYPAGMSRQIEASVHASELLLDLAQIEGARRLARRIVLHGHEELAGHLLHGHQHEQPVEEPIVFSFGRLYSGETCP